MNYIISEFELDIERQELRESGNIVPVQKKVFQLITFLVENRHRALTKDEIQEAVWPGTIVSETAITRAILMARRALKDDVQDQHLIKTVHGHGYRFVGEVLEQPETDPADTRKEEAEQAFRSERSGDLLRAVTAYGAVAWLVNQIAAMIWEAFELDKFPLQILLGASLLGLPIAVAATWYYQFTPEGLRRRDEPGRRHAGAKIHYSYLVIAISLILAVSSSFFWQNKESSNPAIANTPAQQTQNRIAVLPLNNLTDEASNDWTRLGLMSLLSQKLNESGLGTVSSPTVLQMVGDTTNTRVDPELKERFRSAQGATILILPELLQKGELLTLRLVIFDTNGERQIEKSAVAIPTELAVSITDELISRLTPDQAIARYRSGTSLDPFVNEIYARGLFQVLKGNLQQARDLFQVAISQDEGFFLARYQYAITTRYLGEFDEAEPLLVALWVEAHQQEDPDRIVMLSNALGVLYDLQGKLNKAEETYLEGIDLAAKTNLQEYLGHLLVNYAIVEKNRGNLQSARELLGRAITAYQQVGVVVSGAVYNTLANISVNSGNLIEASTYYQQSLANYRQQESLSGEAIALSNLSWLAQQTNQYDQSLKFLSESIAIRESIGDRVGLLKSLVRQADLEYNRGMFDEAKATAARILADDHSRDESELGATALMLLGIIAAHQADFDTAVKHLNEAQQIFMQRQTIASVIRARNLLASTYIMAGDLPLAESLLLQSIDESEQQGITRGLIEAQLQQGKLFETRDGAERALVHYQALLKTVAGLGDENLQRAVSVAYASAQLSVGNIDAAEGTLNTLPDQLDDRDLLLAKAELAARKDQQQLAVQYMQEAKAISFQRWTMTNERQLLAYQNQPGI